MQAELMLTCQPLPAGSIGLWAGSKKALPLQKAPSIY
jgi:hypothetical protein